MPNGRSGGFYLKPPDFERLLRQHPEETVVGETLNQPVTASDLIRILAKSKHREIPIEEQDHSWYIVHLSEWVTVTEKSPLFPSFRKAHADFYREWAKKREKPDGTV